MRKKLFAMYLFVLSTILFVSEPAYAESRYELSNYNNVGYISLIEETGPMCDVATISSGEGDAGGKSYGLSQFTSKGGGASANDFIKWFSEKYPSLSKYFKEVDVAGTDSFDVAWLKTAYEFETEFGQAQLEYTYEKYIKVFIELAEEKFGINFSLTRALQEFAHSSSVQFGPSGSIEILENAGVSANMSETEILEAATVEKINSIGTYKFLGCDQKTRDAVKARFGRELTEFKKIINGTANITGFGSKASEEEYYICALPDDSDNNYICALPDDYDYNTSSNVDDNYICALPDSYCADLDEEELFDEQDLPVLMLDSSNNNVVKIPTKELIIFNKYSKEYSKFILYNSSKYFFKNMLISTL
jgi:hypothetical protein